MFQCLFCSPFNTWLEQIWLEDSNNFYNWSKMNFLHATCKLNKNASMNLSRLNWWSNNNLGTISILILLPLSLMPEYCLSWMHMGSLMTLDKRMYYVCTSIVGKPYFLVSVSCFYPHYSQFRSRRSKYNA